MSNRAGAEAFILEYIGKLLPGDSNVNIYRELFKKMSDEDFEQYIEDLATERKYLVLISPNFSEHTLSIERNLEIAKELDHEFFQRIWIEGDAEIPTHLTPIPYLVVDLPMKRASQLLTKKIKVPDHNKVVDSMTGQPTGESKGAKISYPEVQVCAAMGLEASMTELMKYRGGDIRGHNAMNAMISKHGTANLKTLSNYSSGVESTNTLKTFLTAMMLKSTL